MSAVKNNRGLSKYVALACALVSAAIAGCTAAGLGTADPAIRNINEHALWAIERGLWKEARAALEQALAVNPAHGGIHNNLGIVYEFLGDSLSAQRSYESALRVLPANKEIRRNHEEFLKYKGVFKEYDVSVQGLRTFGEALGRWGKGRTFRLEIRKEPLVSFEGMHRVGIISYQKSRPRGLGGRKDFSEEISDAIRHVLRRHEGLTLVPDHEMRWALSIDRWDTTTVSLDSLTKVRDKIDLDGLIILEMDHASSRVVPGGQVATVITDGDVQIRTRAPRLNVQMSVTMRIVELDSMKVVWQKRFQETVAYRVAPGQGFLRRGIGEQAVAEISESIDEEFKFYLEPGTIEVKREFLLF